MRLPATWLLAAALAMPAAALAQMEAVTTEGRRVLLQPDFTWRYAESAPAAPAATGEPSLMLRVEKVVPRGTSCILGVRMVNGLPYEVRSIVPQFSAVTADGITYTTVYQSFDNIRPTDGRYAEVVFRGIGCADIARVQVHGADRCSMGDLDRFSALGGECLQRITVAPSTLIGIGK